MKTGPVELDVEIGVRFDAAGFEAVGAALELEVSARLHREGAVVSGREGANLIRLERHGPRVREREGHLPRHQVAGHEVGALLTGSEDGGTWQQRGGAARLQISPDLRVVAQLDGADAPQVLE